MRGQVFIADGWRVKAAAILGFGLPLAAGLSCFLYESSEGLYSAFWLIAAAFMLAGGVYWSSSFVRRSIPVVEISDSKIDHRSISLFSKQRSVPTRDVTGILKMRSCLVLSTRSGETKIDTSQLSPARIVEVQSAIEQRIGR